MRPICAGHFRSPLSITPSLGHSINHTYASIAPTAVAAIPHNGMPYHPFPEKRKINSHYHQVQGIGHIRSAPLINPTTTFQYVSPNNSSLAEHRTKLFLQLPRGKASSSSPRDPAALPPQHSRQLRAQAPGTNAPQSRGSRALHVSLRRICLVAINSALHRQAPGPIPRLFLTTLVSREIRLSY